MTEPVQVYSRVAAGPDGDLGTDDDVTTYVVLESTTVTGDTTSVIYNSATIHIAIDRDGDGEDDNVQVSAKIPEAAEYKHIHFGAWAGLGDAKKTGDQGIADLGIGFVQSIGDGLTGADMPNNGSGSYSGNWAATVRAADSDGDGTISLVTGTASLTAEFGKDKITANLDNLARLSGDISGNTFSGEKASRISATHKLDTEGEFTGSFSGGFYGSKAAEAGGIFDFTSDGAEAGEFRGAFGADRTD